MNSEIDLESIREDFPALACRRNGKPPIYFDSACTTLVPRQVIAAIDQYYANYPACGGERSQHWFADEVNNRIEGDTDSGIHGSRQMIAEFINARSPQEIIFALNTTHAINMVALGFRFQPGDVVLLTDKEHNSGLVPWLRLQNRGLIKVDRLVSGAGEIFDLGEFRKRLENQRIRLVSMVYTSNLTGYTMPAKEMIKVAHEHGVKVMLDGAQTVPHEAIDVRDLDVDFLAFSIHKMCGPKGVGVLYGKKELLDYESAGGGGSDGAIEPVILGGGTVVDSNYGDYNLAEVPTRFEAGIQNYPGQIGAGAAVQYLQNIGMARVKAHEIKLNSFLTEQLINRYGDTGWFRILGPQAAAERGGILSFALRRPNCFGISRELSERSNIMIRGGAFCVHSYLNHEFGADWLKPGLPTDHLMTYRVSLYFYNTMEECSVFLDTLNTIFEERGYL
ncbi:MAG: aminotransferase class V-fold PLP-dependent enzyme [Dehalococcoidales bacterium]|nr:aminotransferase class V-fold PLP-dependent enzyme [Dehalococcoidales bacterium]